MPGLKVSQFDIDSSDDDDDSTSSDDSSMPELLHHNRADYIDSSSESGSDTEDEDNVPFCTYEVRSHDMSRSGDGCDEMFDSFNELNTQAGNQGNTGTSNDTPNASQPSVNS